MLDARIIENERLVTIDPAGHLCQARGTLYVTART